MNKQTIIIDDKLPVIFDSCKELLLDEILEIVEEYKAITIHDVIHFYEVNRERITKEIVRIANFFTPTSDDELRDIFYLHGKLFLDDLVAGDGLENDLVANGKLFNYSNFLMVITENHLRGCLQDFMNDLSERFDDWGTDWRNNKDNDFKLLLEKELNFIKMSL